ncbi:hypothetical protein ENLAB_14550 [Enterococcus innesii]|uniref:DUF4325 domain-containing protein n=2 Tax=Enterococcus TaxID=1350 RepID=A0ABM7XS37_9ENTE|nr:hypothetical protein ENLAB_14550 [Enterococcus innesii]
MNVSLVYNNKKLIGKCSKFAIEKVQGTSPFVMLENFETKQPQLNENQQIVLEFLKGIAVKTDSAPIVTFADFGWQHFGSALPSTVEQAYQSMNGKQDLVIMSAYVNWALEQEEE